MPASASPPSGKPGKSGARARQAAARAAAQQELLRTHQRARLLKMVGIPVAVVLLVVATFVVVKLLDKDDTSPTVAGNSGAGATPDQVLATLSTIPAASFDAVGQDADISAPTPITGDPLTADGKPRVLYIGAEYCPFCAAQRWPVVVALSRFGTFSDVGLSASAHDDVYPDTVTPTFHGASYSSGLISFSGWEIATNVPDGSGGYTPLDTLPAADEANLRTYNTQGSIPFLNIGNAYVTIGSSFTPEILAGMNAAQISAAIADPGSEIGKTVLGSANLITAAICQQTGAQPAAVCSSPGVTAAAAALTGS